MTDARWEVATGAAVAGDALPRCDARKMIHFGHPTGAAVAGDARRARARAPPRCGAKKSSYGREGKRLAEQQYARLEAAAAQMAR